MLEIMEGIVDKIENLAFLIASENDALNKNDHILKELLVVLDEYSHSNSEKRKAIRQNIESSVRQNLLIVSENLAIQALMDKRGELVSYAMICHAIEDFKWDSRESILRLAIIWHACKKLKLDPEEIFHKTIKISSKIGVDHFTEFLNREEYMKSTRAMGFEVKTKGKKVEICEIVPPWARN